MAIWFWVWVMLAGVLVVAEVLQPSMLYAPWALGAGVAAALEALGLSITWQWAAFVGLSSVVLVIGRRRFYPVPRPQPTTDAPGVESDGQTEPCADPPAEPDVEGD